MKWATMMLAAVAISVPHAQKPSAGGTADAVKKRLLGNWKLVKYEIFDEAGTARPGAYDVGRLMYDEQGEMSAHLMRSGRSKEPAASEPARAAAYQSYLAYFGPYTIDAEKHIVVHHVTGSSRPDWVGSEQVRYYAFSDDGQYLMLSLHSGERVTQTLTWDRVGR